MFLFCTHLIYFLVRSHSTLRCTHARALPHQVTIVYRLAAYCYFPYAPLWIPSATFPVRFHAFTLHSNIPVRSGQLNLVCSAQVPGGFPSTLSIRFALGSSMLLLVCSTLRSLMHFLARFPNGSRGIPLRFLLVAGCVPIGSVPGGSPGYAFPRAFPHRLPRTF